MIVSLNLPDEIVDFIDRQATQKKLSRSACVAAYLRTARHLSSAEGQQQLTGHFIALMAAGAVRCGLSVEEAVKVFPQFAEHIRAEQARLLAPLAPSAQLPTGIAAADTGMVPNSLSVPVKRRRPYQRSTSRGPGDKSDGVGNPLRPGT